MTNSNLPSVSVVIMNWNGEHFLRKFMPSVMSATWPNLRIIVGDNASDDGSISFLRENYPVVEIIRLDKNYGFAGGYNRVLAGIDSDYFVLLNSDIEVSPGWIEPLVTRLEKDPAIAAAQPKVLSWINRDQFEYAGASGGFIDRFGYPFCRGRLFDTAEQDTGQYNNETEIFWATGAALFIRAKAWKACGGFDERFFAHMEEIDLCWRLKNKGYRIICCPSSTVWHVGGGTLDALRPYKTYLNFRNNLYMLRKNLPKKKARRIIFLRFFLDFISLLLFVVQGKSGHARAISRAHIDYLKHASKYGRKTDVPAENTLTGFYHGSIVWEYFIKKNRKFSRLNGNKFRQVR
jgi:GT2 family glycosyltransferase